MIVVRIEKPRNTTLADWFVELRSWFDNNDCSPILFSRAGEVTNKVLFNITFADHAQAQLFASKFSKYAPSIVRSMSEQAGEIGDGKEFPGSAEVRWLNDRPA